MLHPTAVEKGAVAQLPQPFITDEKQPVAQLDVPFITEDLAPEATF